MTLINDDNGRRIPLEESIRAFVRGAYLALLCRDPDPSGMNTWSQVLTAQGPNAVFRGLLSSDEYRGLFPSDRAFVESLYRQLLGRGADEAGLNGWVQQLSNGASRTDIINGFLGSQEYAQNTRAVTPTVSAVSYENVPDEIKDGENAYKLGCVVAREFGRDVCGEWGGGGGGGDSSGDGGRGGDRGGDGGPSVGKADGGTDLPFDPDRHLG